MIFKLRKLKGKTKLKFHQKISKNHEERLYRSQSGNFQFEEDPLATNIRSAGNFFDEVLVLMEVLD